MSNLAKKLVSFLSAQGGSATARELMQAINITGASDLTARMFLRTALAQCGECEEAPEGIWRLKDRGEPSARQGSTAGASPGVREPRAVCQAGQRGVPETTALRCGFAPYYERPEPPRPDGPLTETRFAVVFAVGERSRRPRAVAASVVLIEGLHRRKTATIVLGRMRRGIFLPGEAAVSALETLLPADVPLVVFTDAAGLAPLRRTFAAVGRDFGPRPIVCMAYLADRLGARITRSSEEDEPGPVSAAAAFCEGVANRLADEFIGMLETLIAKGTTTQGELFLLSTPPGDAVSFEGRAFDESFLKQIPREPGTYWFKNRRGAVLYVGKAKNLNDRVSSYFAEGGEKDAKLSRILAGAHDFGYRVLGSELEALLEEARLIRRHRPPINVQMEVHERTMPGAAHSRKRSVVLFMATPDPDSLQVFLISPTRYALARVRRGARNPTRLLGRVRRFFFQAEGAAHARIGQGTRMGARGPARLRAGKRAVGSSNRRRVPDVELDVIYSWLRHNRDTASFIDVGKTAGYADCARLMKAYLASPETGHAKVERR
ncbi:MAG: nucleotide excision repair endonuclease [Planctomycetota bacterium]|nr:nucleotide excision repair endonuclease [Planctomycetota bacterium]